MVRRPLCSLCFIFLAVVALIVVIMPVPPGEEERSATVVGEVYYREYGMNSSIYYLKDAYLSSDSGSEESLHLIIYLSKDIYYPIGTIVKTEGVLYEPEAATNPGQFHARIYYRAQGIDGCVRGNDSEAVSDSKGNFRIWAKERLLLWKDACCLRLDTLFGLRASKVLKAMLFGVSTEIPEDLEISYQILGIGHLLAVSGLHVSLLGGTLYKGTRRLGVPFWCAAPLAGGLLLCYQEMLGFRCSAFRAVGMFMLLLGAQVTGRAYDRLTALMLTLVVLVAGRPMLILTGGFWLSAVATLGAILGMEKKAEERRCEKEKLWKNEEERGVPVKNRKKEWAKKLWDGISVVVFIQLITLPVQLYVYYELAVYGLLWNLLLVPAASLILGAGIAALFLSVWWIPLGIFAGGTAEVFLLGYELAGKIGKILPGAVYVCGKPEIWQVMVYYGMFALWLWSSRPGKEKRPRMIWGTGFLMAGMLLVFVRFHASLEVTFLDVGQGDCAVVRESGGLCMMVDCGSLEVDNVWEYRVLPFLKHEKVPKLDYVFVSHGDSDHISGLLDMFRRGDIQVRYLVLYDNAGEKSEELKWLARQQGIGLLELTPGEVLRSENVKITCIGPAGETADVSENERSLVFTLESRGVKFLFTGDMEGSGEQKILSSALADSLQADVLKVGHHGSRESSTKEFLSQIQPELAVISCGKNNSYGHPHKETLERLKETGADIMTTPECGAVKVVVKGGNNRSNGIVKPSVILYNKFR